MIRQNDISHDGVIQSCVDQIIPYICVSNRHPGSSDICNLRAKGIKQ